MTPGPGLATPVQGIECLAPQDDCRRLDGATRQPYAIAGVLPTTDFESLAGTPMWFEDPPLGAKPFCGASIEYRFRVCVQSRHGVAQVMLEPQVVVVHRRHVRCPGAAESGAPV